MERNLEQEGPSPDRILYLLKTRGELSTGQLARRLGMTAMGCRLHLKRLQEQGLVACRAEKGQVGRPAQRWNLLPAAAQRFPESYGELAVEILQDVQLALGSKAVEQLLQQRLQRQLRQYGERLQDKNSTAEKVRALAAMRNEEGYMARAEQVEGHWQLIEDHCPICVAAESCQGLCQTEEQLFQQLLGPEAKVKRVEHLLQGARRCRYQVEILSV
ncbi:MAG: winged helix-turn-helix transcriptional regulator [Planctomycetota bacterium]|nr:MAG: winged helix-turn-helix transcriptional regulator [Planctomycetota bacterium]